MGLLVKFIAAEDKKEIEHEEYVNKIFEDLCNAGLIKNIMLTPDEMKDKENPVRELDDEENHFLLISIVFQWISRIIGEFIFIWNL